MIKHILFIIQILIFLTALPLHAYDINPVTPGKHPPLSVLTEEQIRNSPAIVEDYHTNELATHAVSRQITLFTERIREKFSLWLSRSGKYLELMTGILKEQDIPEEMVFLPLIESGFNPNAYSPANAAGYWQFISSTAKRYGLAINWWRDERRDPVKSTVAAANYLKDLHEMFGSWNLAMAAYNAGEGKIMRALNRTKADDYWSLLPTNQIKKETKDYVPKFIAASLIAYNPENYGFSDLEFHPPLSYETVILQSPIDLEVAAECAEVPLEVIRDLNPELKRWCTPPDTREYSLRIPEGKKEIFQENLSLIPEKDRFTVDLYTVRKKDTFLSISRKTGVPVEVILDLNDMEHIMPLSAGTKIYLPPKGKFVQERQERSLVKKTSLKQRKSAVKGNRSKSKKPAVKVSNKQKQLPKNSPKRI
jgi:membrane-bound lytic murein transglycosylase D